MAVLILAVFCRKIHPNMEEIEIKKNKDLLEYNRSEATFTVVSLSLCSLLFLTDHSQIDPLVGPASKTYCGPPESQASDQISSVLSV